MSTAGYTTTIKLTLFHSNPQNKLCVICLCDPKSVSIQPCNHLALCSECGEELGKQPRGRQKCPICRQVVTGFVVFE